MVCTFLEYESLVSVIKKEWKQMLRNNTSINLNYIIQDGCFITINQTKRKLKDINTRDIYWHNYTNNNKQNTNKRK